MGQLIYASHIHLVIDDTTLAHVEAIAGAKLRMNQPFYLSWTNTINTGESHMSIWLSTHTALQFHYLCNHQPPLDRDRIADMWHQANSPTGLRLQLDPIAPHDTLTPSP